MIRDSEVMKRKYLIRMMLRENAMILKKGYLNTHVSRSLSSEVGNMLK